MKHSRRGTITALLREGETDLEILAILDKKFPPGSNLTSNKQAIAGTKWDLGMSNKRVISRVSSAPAESNNKSSIDYRTYFEYWRNWNTFENPFDGVNGVYAFRLKQVFERLKGTSNVLLIGMADQNPDRKRSGLYHRLRNYRQNNSGASKRLKEIAAYFGGLSQIEYAYCQCKSPRVVERALLNNYCFWHLELPPLNRAG
jgi:hypothetical protein